MNNSNNFLVKAIVATLVITGFSLLADQMSGRATSYFSYLWNLLANALVVSILGAYVTRSTLRSIKLWVSTFLIYYVIGYFNILIEAWVFNVTSRPQTSLFMFTGIPFSALGAVVITYFFRPDDITARKILVYEPRRSTAWIGRILAGNFLYFPLYLIAGMMLQALTPGFQEFYGDKVPPFMDIVLTNVFFRGFIFVGIALLIDRTMEASAWVKGLVIGGIFAIVGGIAPLIPPNEFMPAFIRRAHGVEVGVSNFLYGMLLFRILKSNVRYQEEPITSGLAT